jgi:hypothetical protein
MACGKSVVIEEHGQFIKCDFPAKQRREEGISCDFRKITDRVSGGSQDYYKVMVNDPTSGGPEYEAECNDIIEALGLNYAEATVIKAIWRMSAHRRGLQSKADPLYDAEKVAFFARRILRQNGGDDEEVS